MAFKFTEINGISKITNTENDSIVYNFDIATVVIQDNYIKVFTDVMTSIDYNDILNVEGNDAESIVDELANNNYFSANTQELKTLQIINTNILNSINSQIEVLNELKFLLKAIAE